MPMPMDDASSVFPEAPAQGAIPQGGGNGKEMGNAPAMGGTQNSDPSSNMGEDPNMGGDPNAMGGAKNGNPNAIGGTESEGPNEMPNDDENQGDGGDSTIDIINQLSDKDRETVRSYAKSLLKGSGAQDGENEQPPIAESVIFSKKQIKAISENLMDVDNNNKEQNLGNNRKKKHRQVSKKSPFSAPKFN